MKDSKPTIYDPNFLPTNIYSGVPTFLNLPVLENKQDLAPSPSARRPSGTPAICPILTWTASPS